jgi:ankyrin repeat protein
MSKPKTQCSITPPHTLVSQLHSPCSVFVIPCGRSGSTPFLASCYDGRVDICKVLFESGADIAAKDDRYNTHSFFSFKHSISAPFSIYVILLRRDFTALHKCCDEGHIEVCKFLVERRADLAAKTRRGRPSQAARSRRFKNSPTALQIWQNSLDTRHRQRPQRHCRISSQHRCAGTLTPPLALHILLSM